MLVKIPGIIRKLYPKAIWKIKTSEKKIFLTFDDGPDPDVTPEVLDILKKYNAKATFFCVGENVKKHPEVYEKIIDAGHIVGNHTYNHLKGWKTKNSDYFKNIELAGKYIPSNLFRPPHGSLKFSQYAFLKKKYEIIMWDVLSMDFDKNTTKEQCVENVLKYSKPGSIIIFHDSKKMKEKVLYALPKVLGEFNTLNYKIHHM